jgi:hypothetical protein
MARATIFFYFLCSGMSLISGRQCAPGSDGQEKCSSQEATDQAALLQRQIKVSQEEHETSGRNIAKHDDTIKKSELLVETKTKLAENSTGFSGTGPKSGWLEAHNMYRCMHGVGNVQWDESIAKGALKWIKMAGFNHASNTGLGENLGWHSNSNYKDAAGVTKLWYDEVGDCYWPGCQSGSGAVGHFTALVWEGVTKIGCAFHNGISICRYKNSGSCGPNCGGYYTQNVHQASKSQASCAAGSSGSTTLSGCAPNDNNYCYCYKPDGSWCWLMDYINKNYIKEGNGGWSCASYDGYAGAKYCAA